MRLLGDGGKSVVKKIRLPVKTFCLRLVLGYKSVAAIDLNRPQNSYRYKK